MKAWDRSASEMEHDIMELHMLARPVTIYIER